MWIIIKTLPGRDILKKRLGGNDLCGTGGAAPGEYRCWRGRRRLRRCPSVSAGADATDPTFYLYNLHVQVFLGGAICSDVWCLARRYVAPLGMRLCFGPVLL